MLEVGLNSFKLRTKGDSLIVVPYFLKTGAEAMSEECKDCPYQIGNNSRIDKIEKDIDGIWGRLRTVETAVTSQTENTKMIFDILGELKLSVKSIEKALYEREDPFKKIVYEFGLFIVKAGIIGGAIVWLVVEFGGAT